MDHEVDTEEMDCKGDSARPFVSQEFDGAEIVAMTILSSQWGPVAPGRCAVFDASCAWLLGGFAPRLPRRVVYAMRFRPARVNRAPVPVWITLPVTFSLACGPGSIPPGSPSPLPPLPPSPRPPARP